MQAYAEGFAVLRHKDGDSGSTWPAVGEIWRQGSVIRSWLLDLAADALAENPAMRGSRRTCPTRAKVGGRWPKRSTSTSRRR